ncbi:MAG: septal ring lytic transglycosylase RlpA family protein [Candidatus Anaerobiospirillum merdipullorum]|uniref:Endolytic peptidoglycan transglycosylase RlpA n=1 Tax=Candidatus Anaerobiospirillum merdipullorum TaxID=2838450 RepID=A0A9E2NSS7_9GAMM|nr:septal ring lytic transglycosylase RlpA family protein [Candidatus Anaerobiospirillum merdipullorum]
MKFAYFSLPLLLFALGTTLTLNGCSSNSGEINATHGAKAEDGAIYGSGPNNTKPYPQSEPVNLNGVGGATVRYEPLSRGGNKNYTVLGKNYQVWRDCNSYLEIGTASWYGPGFHGNNTSNGEVYNQKGYSAAHKNLPLPSYLKVTNLENGKAVIVRVNDRGPFHGNRIIDLSEGAARAINMTGKGTATVKLEYIDVRQGNIIANLAHSVNSGQGNTTDATQGSKQDAIGDLIATLPPSTLPSSGANSDATPAQSAPAVQVSYVNNLGSTTPTGASSLATATAYVQIFTTMDQKRAARVQQDYRNNTSYPIVIAAEEGLYRVRIGPVPDNDVPRVLHEMRNLGFKDAFVKR